VHDVYTSVKGSIVRVEVQTGTSTSTGTGFLINAGKGTVVTAAHVVSGASQAQVRFGDSHADIDAEVLGTDASSDLAVLRVDSSNTKGHRPIPLADSGTVKVGDVAIAIGYPFGLEETVTQGIVSGVGRAIEAPNGFSIDKVIQTDAPINPGNSGGPLLDAAGRVIGVNSQIATSGGGSGNVGIGYAVPSNTVRQVVPRLRVGGTIRRAYLGVESGTDSSGRGARIASVVPGSPADRGGVLPGDIVSAIDGRAVESSQDVVGLIGSRKPGDEVEIEVQRGGAKRSLRVTLGTQPQTAQGLSPAPGP
jgi:S1-C subfamily serine protease